MVLSTVQTDFLSRHILDDVKLPIHLFQHVTFDSLGTLISRASATRGLVMDNAWPFSVTWASILSPALKEPSSSVVLSTCRRISLPVISFTT